MLVNTSHQYMDRDKRRNTGLIDEVLPWRNARQILTGSPNDVRPLPAGGSDLNLKLIGCRRGARSHSYAAVRKTYEMIQSSAIFYREKRPLVMTPARGGEVWARTSSSGPDRASCMAKSQLRKLLL